MLKFLTQFNTNTFSQSSLVNERGGLLKKRGGRSKSSAVCPKMSADYPTTRQLMHRFRH